MNISNLRIVFGGTPDFAEKHLKFLIEQGLNIVAVYTQPDRQSGRGKKIQSSPVKTLAIQHNIPVEQPFNFKTQTDIDKFREYKPDLFIVVAYGVILPKVVLDIPAFGCINVHGSLLPKYRGAAPIQRAIFEGELETGITIMKMNEGLDTGDIITTEKCLISKKDTSDSLFEKLIPLGQKSLLASLSMIVNDEVSFVKQDESQATYAKKITKTESKINFSQKAEIIDRQIRTYVSWPVAFFSINDIVIKVWEIEVMDEKSNKQPGEIIKIDSSGIYVATLDNVINLKLLQLPGKKVMKTGDVLNGHKNLFSVGLVL